MDVFVIIFTVLAVLGLLAIYMMAGAAKNEAVERLRSLSIASVDQMSGVEFEHYAAALLENEGFTGVKVTPASGDNGVDIVAARDNKRYAIQVKRYKGAVSRRAVSDAVAGMLPYSCNASMVITTSHLSTKAMEFARAHGCEVVHRDILADWITRFQAKRHSLGSTELLAAASATRDGRTDYANEINNAPNDATLPYGTSREFQTDTGGPIPAEIARELKRYASSRHPGDYATMEYVIDEGLKAYRELSAISVPDMPSEAYSRLRDDALRAHPADYSTQLYVVSEQISSFRSLQRLRINAIPDEVLRKIAASAEELHPFDFSTQLYVVKEQARAFAAIAQMGE